MSFREESPIALVHGILHGYARYGVDPGPALRAAQIPVALLDDAQARVSSRQIVDLTTLAMRQLDDEGLGLYSRRLPCGCFEMIARACVSAPDLGVALRRWCRYRRLLIDDLSVLLQVQGDVATLHIDEHRPLGELRDFTLLSVLRHVHGLACWFVDSRVPLIEAAFPGDGPAHRAAYALMFPGPVRFGAARASLSFSAAYLGLPVQRDEAATRTMLSQSVSLIIKPYQRDRLLLQRTRALLSLRHASALTADRLAGELNLSARSLHRHLAGEGTSLQQLKDEVRLEQAIEWLNRSSLPLKRIATQLAFSSEKSFTRAFRRWTGMTPTAWRQRYRAARAQHTPRADPPA